MSDHQLVIRDTLTRKKQPVTPGDSDTLRFYCCGPTVYGPAHIGNFRTFLAQDLFRRVVELSGTPTKHVRNVTDVDDKTIRDSIAAGKSLKEFTSLHLGHFHADAAALNLLPPHVEPGAVDHIPEQIALIETLITKGLAYAGEDGSVYFRIAAYPGYGRLSGVQDRELKTGASETANDADEYDKDNLADFVLWKSRKPEDGDNFWPSPWGEGRPGWHLECSAMGMKYLGESFDLHSGGVDLCFPHHENEIAQSEGATGKTFARLWFHVEHLMVDSTKMSKSLGNLYTLTDIQGKGHTAAELRYALLAGHYRQKLNFTLDSLHAAKLNLARIAGAAAKLSTQTGASLTPYDELVTSHAGPGPFSEAWSALLRDLNTPAALGHLFSSLKPIEKQLAAGTLTGGEATAALAGLSFVVAAFGLELPAPDSPADIPAEILALAEQRYQAKLGKDWATSDSLRDQVAAAGFTIKDSRDGYEVLPAS